MKTTSKILSIGIVLIILITGCKKNQSSITTEQQAPVDKQKIESNVKYCTGRILSSVKTIDSIPVDSLKFYIEATANFTYGNASSHGESQKSDTNFLKLVCRNSKIALNDVINAYTCIIDSVRSSYRRIPNRNKNLVSVSVNIIDIQSDKVMIKVNSIIIYGNNYQVAAFDTTDYWIWWNMGYNQGGKCGPYSGHTDLDAAIKIQQHVMLRKGTPNGYYVSPIDITIEPWSYVHSDNTQGDCYFKYYLFDNADNLSCFHICLMPFEMNWYLLGAEYICYTSNTASPDHGARPSGYDFISLYLHGDIAWGTYPNYIDQYLIHGTVKYGIFISGGSQSPL